MFGFPNLASGLTLNTAGISLLGQGHAALWGLLSGDNGWGIYLTGTTTLAFSVDSVNELAVRADTAVADYKTETGAFTTYDKVQQPREYPLRLIVGGSAGERSNFVLWLEASRGDVTQLFDIAMPETSYESVTLMSYSFQRSSSSGAALIIADCVFREVRIIPQTYVNSATGQTISTQQTTANAAAPSAQPPSLLQRVTAQVPGTKTITKIAARLGWS